MNSSKRSGIPDRNLTQSPSAGNSSGMFKTAKNLFSKKFQFKIGGKTGSNVMDEPSAAA
jgi:hypothetical protein